jgi:hypothetical protein
MNTKATYIIITLLLSITSFSQEISSGNKKSISQKSELKDRLSSWKLYDDFTFLDSVAIDTATTGFQNYDPILKDGYSTIFLGNKGSAYYSNLLSHKLDCNEFIFLNALQKYLIQPADIQYYNTKVPYTNLSYYYGAPKRRSEENFSALFTQNINKYWNFGAYYNLVSSIGLYEAQQVDNRNFKFHMSYHGTSYNIHGAFIFNKAKHLENGGLEGDEHNYILNPDTYDYGAAENIPVKYMSASNQVNNTQLFIHQALGIGRINLAKKSDKNTDEEEVKVPVSTVYHTLHLSRYKRLFAIDNLDSYYDESNALPLFQNVFGDSLQTNDSITYTSISNTFQIKFNEEANSLLRFGLRAYLQNEVKHYNYQVTPDINKVNDETIVNYKYNDTTLVTTSVGGQIFKNIGKNFKWKADGKLYLQGYKAGDIEVNGDINMQYPVFKDTAGIFTKGKMILRYAEFLQENYYSNHFQWTNNFVREKLVNVEVGLNVPTRKFKLAWESKTYTDYFYWNYDAQPDQYSNVISVFQLSLSKDFKWGPLHSNNKIAYQYSSQQDIYPLPEFAAYSSSYFNFYLAKRVLQVQIGVDAKYHTAYYAPAYMPATGQFYLQDKQVIGNYPFLDLFMNLHLKRARIFVKLDHFNQSLNDRNYFLTVGYPYAPIRLKWGVSWNFYD